MARRSRSHDQLFKDLMRTFFDQLIELVAPELVGELDLQKVEFLEQELFSDLPEGKRSVADLVAKVRAAHGETKLVLVHGEIEGAFRRSTARRLWRYSMHLMLKHQLPVVTLVLYLKGGRGDVRRERLVQKVGEVETHTFSYYAFGLARSDARKYLARPQELAWSLAALMDRGDWDRPQHKLACWLKLAQAKVNPARQFLLTNIVETYIELEEDEQADFEHQLEQHAETERVRAMQMTWAEKLERRGLEKGREQGLEKGREQGLERGLEQGRCEGMRHLLAQLLEQRFGTVPKTVLDRLSKIKDTKRLEQLTARLFDARSLDDLGL